MFLFRVSLCTAILLLISPAASNASDHGPAHAQKTETATAPAPVSSLTKPGFFATVWHAFLLKLERMQTLDENNAALRTRTAELEVENARLAEQYSDCREHKRAEQIKEEAQHEGGTETARTIASLSTADEALLSHPPKAIFEQAMRAFNGGDFETAAKAFAFLAHHPENDSYKDANTFFMAGVSLFKVENYKKALWHFEQAHKHATGEDVSFAPRALGWVALCQAKLGDKKAEQAAVRELIQKYPKSKEARRLNRHA